MWWYHMAHVIMSCKMCDITLFCLLMHIVCVMSHVLWDDVTCPVWWCHMFSVMMSHVLWDDVTCFVWWCHMFYVLMSHVLCGDVTCSMRWCHMFCVMMSLVLWDDATCSVWWCHMFCVMMSHALCDDVTCSVFMFSLMMSHEMIMWCYHALQYSNVKKQVFAVMLLQVTNKLQREKLRCKHCTCINTSCDNKNVSCDIIASSKYGYLVVI